MRNAIIRFGLIVVVALVWVAAETASAQRTTSTDVRSFEVVTVDGNKLVVREESGTREYTVPADFRFDVDGKSVAVSALKPGMKGKATFTTITTSTPVYVTEVREAEVIQVSGGSLLVRGRDGFRMWSPGEVEKRNIRIMKDGRPVEFTALHKGDRLTATIVTEGPPKTLTETQVQAVLTSAAPTAAPTPAPVPAPAPVESAAAPSAASAAAPPSAAAAPSAATAPPSAAPPAAPAAAASNATQTAPPAPAPPETAGGMGIGMLMVIGLALVLVAVIWFIASRRQAQT